MEQLKENLLHKGASLVGFAKLQGTYNKIEELEVSASNLDKDYRNTFQYPFGIAIAVKVPKEVIKGISDGPTNDYYNAYHDINDKLDEIAMYCEEYLTSKGYHAYAQTVDRVKEYGIYNTIMPHKTVAVRAGIGWIGKSALLVTPEFGSAVRLTSVLTDAPLTVNEITQDSPCKKCNVCKEACPAHAVVGNVWRQGVERDYIFNALKCRETARKIAKQAIGKEVTLCGKCIVSCPFTQRYLKG